MPKNIRYLVIFLCFILLLYPCNLLTQTGWFPLSQPSSSFHLYGVFFANVNEGVASRYRTTNGGLNWIQTVTSIGDAMYFPNNNTGYCVGNGIQKTTNLGQDWIGQDNPGDYMNGVYFINSNTGYACGDFAGIVKTINGGTNWILLSSPLPSSHHFNGVFFIDVNTGYISGYITSDFSSVILKTTNGGDNWTVQNFPSGTGYYSIFFVNANTGIVIGEKAAKTTNAGASWVEKSQSVTTFQHSLFFSSVNTGYSTGFSGNIIKTTDGGETWFRQNSGTGRDLESVYFLNDYTGFVCGDYGVVLKTTDGGGPPIGINPISSEVPSDFSLYQNYPNPFNPVTKIVFDLPKSSTTLSGAEGNGAKGLLVKLIVYDILGKEVSELVNFALSPGTYEVEWQASNYPSGVYFYTLTAGSYRATKRMVLLK